MIKLKDLIKEGWNSDIWNSDIEPSNLWNSNIEPSNIWEMEQSNDIESDVNTFNYMIKSKYGEYLDQFHIMYVPDKNKIILTDIFVKSDCRKKGIGSKIMKELIKFADEKHLPITLTPAGESWHPKILNRLKNFYKRFGFSNLPNFDMIRLPK